MEMTLPGLTSFSLDALVLETHEPVQFVDITDTVNCVLRQRGYGDGLVIVFSRHTTAAIRVQEHEPLLLEDFRDFLAAMAPRDGPYRHNDVEARGDVPPEEPPNGHSHCLHMLLGASESVPIVDGTMQLGRWQRLFLIELDGPRAQREVLVQVFGCKSARGGGYERES